MDAKAGAREELRKALWEIYRRPSRANVLTAQECAIAYAAECVATATGPERDLADLERLARQHELPAQVESVLRVYESDGTTRYQDEFSRRNITRADALALLREKGAKDA